MKKLNYDYINFMLDYMKIMTRRTLNLYNSLRKFRMDYWYCLMMFPIAPALGLLVSTLNNLYFRCLIIEYLYFFACLRQTLQCQNVPHEHG